MCPQRHLLQAGDHLLGCDFLLGLRPAIAQIIGAQHNDHMGHAGLRQHVAIEAAQAAVAADVVQDAVAAETLVHDAHRAPVAGDQPSCKLIRPAAECVVRGDVRVGQRIAERDNAAGAAGANTSMPPANNQSSVIRPTGIIASAEKSPGGEM
jgi:hypothetical protein